MIKTELYVVDEYSKDTFAIVYKNTRVSICPEDSTGLYQHIGFRAYIKCDDELSGKIQLSKSAKDSVLAWIKDTVCIFQDDQCTKCIGKVLNNKGLGSRGFPKTINYEFEFYGIVDGKKLVDRQPWKHLLAGINEPNIYHLTHELINKHLENIGISSGETWNDSGYVFDYILIGCSPIPIVKAIFVYSKDTLAAYWSEEIIKSKNKEKLNGKFVYFTYGQKKSVGILKQRLKNECKGGIGSPEFEGCYKK